MSDKKVSVIVEIGAENKTTEAAKEVEKAAERIEKAAEKAADAMGGLGKAAAGVGTGAGGPGSTAATAGTSGFIADQMRLLGADVSKLRTTIGATGTSGASLGGGLFANMAKGVGAAFKSTLNGASGGSAQTLVTQASAFVSAFANSPIVQRGQTLLTSGASQGWQWVKSGVVAGFQASKSVLASIGSGAKAATSGAVGWMQQGITPGQGAKAGQDIAEGMKRIAFGLGIATAAATGFVASMAPMTFSTLTQSIQLLGGQFATLLIPSFSMASLKIQQLTGWLASMDDATKGAISSWATWAAPGAVVLGILGAAAPILKLVTGGFLLLASGILGASRAALAFVATPWGAGLTAAAVTVGLLTNGFGLLGDSIARAGERADQARERIVRLQGPGASVTRQDFESLDAGLRRRVTETPEIQRRAVIEGFIQSRESVLRRDEQGGEPERRAAIIEQTLSQLNTGSESGQQRRDAIVRDLTQAGFTRTSAEFNLRGVNLQGSLDPRRSGRFNEEEIRNVSRQASGINSLSELRNEIEVLRRVREQGVPGLFEGLRTSTPMQAQMFGSGADAYYQVLQEVSSRGQLEQDILKEIMKNTEIMVNQGNRPPPAGPQPPPVVGPP